MTRAVILDLVVLIAVSIVVIRGWSHRSIREFFSLAGLFVGVVIAPFVVGPLAVPFHSWMNLDANLARVIALALAIAIPALVGAVIGVRTSANVVQRGPAALDGTGGSAFAMIRAITIVSLLLYGTLAVSGSATDEDSFIGAIDDSATGQLLANPDSPFTIFYDGLLARSDELQALTLWVRQRSGFREQVPTDRLDFPATDEPLTAAPDVERSLVRLLNDDRDERGLLLLNWCGPCARVARSHSKDMYRNGYFSHVDSNGDDPFDRMQEAGIAYDAAGENLSIAPSVNQAHDRFMSSSDHRANILREIFDEVGVGCYEGPYGYMCTQVFRDRPG